MTVIARAMTSITSVAAYTLFMVFLLRGRE